MIPPAIELPVVVPKVPARILSGVAFPIVLPVIVIEAAETDETFIPNAAPGKFAAVGWAEVKLPNVLLLITTFPVVELLMPTRPAAVAVVGVVVSDPVPVTAPNVFGVTFPIFTFPEEMFTPHNEP